MTTDKAYVAHYEAHGERCRCFKLRLGRQCMSQCFQSLLFLLRAAMICFCYTVDRNNWILKGVNGGNVGVDD